MSGNGKTRRRLLHSGERRSEGRSDLAPQCVSRALRWTDPIQALARRTAAFAPLLLAQHEALDFSTRRLRQGVDEGDLTRIGVRREPLAHVAAQVLGERVARGIALPQDDEGLDDFGTFRVRLPDRRRLAHSGMLDQRALDLERADPITGRGDDVVVAENSTYQRSHS